MSAPSADSTAVAAGRRRAQASKALTAVPPGTGAAVSFHSTSTCASSAGARNGSSESRASGCSTMPASSSANRRSRRSTVAGSKRSRSYSTSARRPPDPSTANASVRSNFALALPAGTCATSSPGQRGGGAGVFCTTSTTWNSGGWTRSRGGWSASTSPSNGSSWWAKASSVASRVRARSVATVGSPRRSPAWARVLTKQPIRPSVAACVRPATGDPTASRSLPVVRDSSVW